MNPDPQKHHRHSIRLPEYDYSHPGGYFFTTITHERVCLFGEIKEGEMCLNEAGNVVWDIWNSIPERYPQVSIFTAIVMPNHFHAIVLINEINNVGVIHDAKLVSEQGEWDELPLQDHRKERRRMTLPLLVGYFKMNTAKRINQLLGLPGKPVWQKNYYEHIIRNDEELNRIHLYIEANVANWALDDENPLKGRFMNHPDL